jgi:hypothetical protein
MKILNDVTIISRKVARVKTDNGRGQSFATHPKTYEHLTESYMCA